MIAETRISAAVREKEEALLGWLAAQPSVLIGFSGGVDSSYLAACAMEVLGSSRTLAVIGRSASFAESQWVVARSVADRIGVPVLEVDTEEMQDARYVSNPANRCYFCKTELWGKLVPIARERGFAVVVDGTNASDVSDYRPGSAAAREHGVLAPLVAAGLTKEEIRILSRARGLPTWAQPSAPCLASRLPYGTAVTPERLGAVEMAEASLRVLGIGGDLRVRHHGALARIELAPDEVGRWLHRDRLSALTDAVRRAGFTHVALDVRGFRSGALNVLAGVTADAAAGES